VSVDTVLAVQEALGGSDGFFSRIENVERHTAALTIASGAMGSPAPEVVHGWHLKSADRGWTAALLPEQFSLETTRYTNWGEFHSRLRALIEAIEKIDVPSLEQRIGLRYVDRLVGLPVTAAVDWARWISAPILGAPLHDVVGPAVRSVRQQVEFDLEGDTVCALRHGLATEPDGDAVYVLDFDMYREKAQRFSGKALLGAANQFHQQADALFQQVITDDLLTYLSGQRDD
jgi:uncharacterized protein (TIGR04255 family)